MVGAGYIAVELAGVLNGLGSDVTLIVRGAKALRRFDVSGRWCGGWCGIWVAVLRRVVWDVGAP